MMQLINNQVSKRRQRRNQNNEETTPLSPPPVTAFQQFGNNTSTHTSTSRSTHTRTSSPSWRNVIVFYVFLFVNFIFGLICMTPLIPM